MPWSGIFHEIGSGFSEKMRIVRKFSYSDIAIATQKAAHFICRMAVIHIKIFLPSSNPELATYSANTILGLKNLLIAFKSKAMLRKVFLSINPVKLLFVVRPPFNSINAVNPMPAGHAINMKSILPMDVFTKLRDGKIFFTFIAKFRRRFWQACSFLHPFLATLLIKLRSTISAFRTQARHLLFMLTKTGNRQSALASGAIFFHGLQCSGSVTGIQWHNSNLLI